MRPRVQTPVLSKKKLIKTGLEIVDLEKKSEMRNVSIHGGFILPRKIKPLYI
jgi:hypothetical protein